jgi:EmrB/QacA subfamily drug resistance transporter
LFRHYKGRLGIGPNIPRVVKIPIAPPGVLAGLMLALALAALDQNIMATAMPSVTGELGGLQHLSWVITAFMVASTVSAPLYGRLSDLYGRRPAFTVSIGVFLSGSVLCGAARDMEQLIAFRIVQGLGAGGLFVLAQTVIADLVPPRERGRYQALSTGTFVLCSVAGPLLGGVLTQYASWRWIFYVNVPVGAASLALITKGLKTRPPGPAPQLDLLGATLLTVGICCVLWTLSSGGNVYAWDSGPIRAVLTVGIAALALLVPVEYHAPQPILPPGLFRNRVFVVGAAVLALVSMALLAAAVFLPLLFQLLMGASPSRSGTMLAPLMGGLIVASFVGGRLIVRTGRYKWLSVLGLLTVTTSFAALAVAARASIGAAPIIAVLVILGLGVGLVMPTLTTAIQNAVPSNLVGGATATAGFFRSLGGALGVALAGTVLALHLQTLPGASQRAASGIDRIARLPAAQRSALLDAYRAGFFAAFVAGTTLAGVGLLVSLFLPELPLRSIADRID